MWALWGGPDEQAGGLVMKKSVFARAIVAGALLAAMPVAAHAAEGDYTPGVGGSATLVGSDVSGFCDGATPSIAYSVVLTDPDNQITERDAHLVLSNGSESTTITLGTLGDDGKLAGSIAWPTEEWTHGDVSATVVVNPEVSVPLSYPSDCDVTGTASGGEGALAVTGSDFAALPFVVGGGAVLLAGAGLLVYSRRRAH